MGLQKYSNKGLLNKLKKFADEINKTPSRLDFQKHQKNYLPSHSTYVKRFGTYKNACLLAGLEPNESFLNEYEKISDREMLNKFIHYAYKLNKIPTMKEVDKAEKMPSSENYRFRFGSWGEVINKTNLKNKLKTGSYTKERLLYLLEYFTEQKQRYLITYADLDEIKEIPNTPIYKKYFGDIYKAYEKLNICKKQINYFCFIFEVVSENFIQKNKFLSKYENNKQEVIKTINNLLKTLNEREEEIIIKKYGLQNSPEMFLYEVGNDLNITGERVRQLQNKALRKLKHPTRINKIKILFK